MTESIKSLYRTDDSPATGAETPDAALSTSVDALWELISSQLKARWVEDEPGEKCFDRDESRMASLRSFVEKRTKSTDNQDVANHLLTCPRCRFIYARVREISRLEIHSTVLTEAQKKIAPKEPIPDLLRDNLRSTGPVVFPGQELTEGAWEFGLLGTLPSELADEDL